MQNWADTQLVQRENCIDNILWNLCSSPNLSESTRTKRKRLPSVKPRRIRSATWMARHFTRLLQTGNGGPLSLTLKLVQLRAIDHLANWRAKSRICSISICKSSSSSILLLLHQALSNDNQFVKHSVFNIREKRFQVNCIRSHCQDNNLPRHNYQVGMPGWADPPLWQCSPRQSEKTKY